MNKVTDDWSQYLESALFAINTSIQGATKFTPFRIMFGREPLFPQVREKAFREMKKRCRDDHCSKK